MEKDARKLAPLMPSVSLSKEQLFPMNVRFIDLLKSGSSTWNEWREANPLVQPLLPGADLASANLRDYDLSNVYLGRSRLTGVDLVGANLYQTEFYKADLTNADLSKSEMAGAKLYEAILHKANLSGAQLYRVDFIGTNLMGTDFSRAVCGVTSFCDVALDDCIGLATTSHLTSSHVDASTLDRIHGDEAREFARRCGVPGRFLEAPHMEPEHTKDHQSCFISYSHRDERIVDRLYWKLRDEGIRAWFAPEEMKPGKKVHEQIYSAIEDHDRLILVLSDFSMNSPWVHSEIKKARLKELRTQRRVLFPIRVCSFDTIRSWTLFDSDNGSDLAQEIRQYYVPDFSEMEGDSFDREFRKLVDALREAEEHQQ